MAIYILTAPNGREIEIESATPPTDALAQEVFKAAGIGFEQPQAESANDSGSDLAGRILAADKGLTFGFGRKTLGRVGGAIGGGIAGVVNALNGGNWSDVGTGIAEGWDNQKELRQTLDDYAERKPMEALAIELGSSFANPVNKLGVGFIGKGSNLVGKVARGAGVSGAIGGLAGAGDSESIDELASNVAGGTATGMAVGGALPLVGNGLKLVGRGAKQILGKTTGAGDKAIADAFAAGTRGDKSFLRQMAEDINAEGLEKKIENNFNKIKQARNMTYEDDITRLKMQTADQKLDLKPVIEDIKSIIRQEGGGADYLVDDNTAKVLSKTKETINKFAKDPNRHNLEGFDNLKKKLQNIVNTKEGTNADRVKSEISKSVKGQILKQSPEYKAIQDNYARDSEILNDLKQVFSLNRNANSETILRKVQSTARNNANTDWGYRGQLLNKIDPTGEIQREISANALNTWTPRGLIGSGAFYGGIFSANPLLLAASSPRAVGYGAYMAGKAASKVPNVNISPYIAQLLAQNQ
jgi:hypothetical protein